LAFVTAYKELLSVCRDHGVDDLYAQLEGVAGTSVGAIMSLAVCLAISPSDMLRFFDTALLKQVQDNYISQVKCGRPSYLSSKPIWLKLRNALREHGLSENTTFYDFFRYTGKDLRIGAHNIKSEKGEIFSVYTSPDICVIDAVMASSSMPFVFPAVKTGRTCQCYMDGGTSELFFPMHEFPHQYTLGIYLYDKYRKSNKHKKFFRLLAPKLQDHIISIDVTKLGALQFNLTSKLKDFIANQAISAVRLYFS